MVSNRNAVRAGAFIVASALFSLGVVVVVSGPERFSAKRTYTAIFDVGENLQGIRPGDEVRLGGLRVGSVTSVDLDDTTDPARILVSFSMPKKYKLKQGATIAVEALIGSASLNVDNLGTGAELGEKDRINGLPSPLTRLAGIAPKIEAMVEDVRVRTLPKMDMAIDEYRMLAVDARQKVLPQAAAAADEGAAIAREIRGDVQKALDSYYRVTGEARTAMKNIGDFIGPSTGPATADFKQTLANLKDATGSIKTEIPELTSRAKTVLDQMNDRLTTLKATAEDVRVFMASARSTAGTLDSVLLNNRAKIDRIMASIETTTANAKLFTAEVLRRPSRLIWKDDAKTQANLANYFNARDFAQGAQDLNDAASALKDALKDPRITDEELKRRTELLDTTFSRFNSAEEKLWKGIKE